MMGRRDREVAGNPDRALAMTAELHQTAVMARETYTAVTGRFDDALDPAGDDGPRGESGYLAALPRRRACASPGPGGSGTGRASRSSGS